MRIALAFLAVFLTFGYVRAQETTLADSLEGYWLVIAAKFPEGPFRGRDMVAGSCERQSCEAGSDNRPMLWGRLDLSGVEIGPVARFQGEVWGDFRITARFEERDHLQAFMPYGRQLILEVNDRKHPGGMVWVLVKDPDNSRFQESLWNYVDRARRQGEGFIIHMP